MLCVSVPLMMVTERNISWFRTVVQIAYVQNACRKTRGEPM
jgi:hypothetical protein